MEPACAFKYLCPVKIFCACFCDRGVCAVINDFAWALGSTFFTIVYANAFAAADYIRGVDPESAKGIDGCLTHLVLGELGNEVRLHTVICKADCNVCLCAAKGRFKSVCLNES